jgi:hypothetical protein
MAIKKLVVCVQAAPGLPFLSMARKAMRQHVSEHAAEFLFAFLYIAFLFTYNSQRWAGTEFPRFAIPVIPFLLLSLREWIPKPRAVLYSLSVISPVLAASSALGINNVIHALMR